MVSGVSRLIAWCVPQSALKPLVQNNGLLAVKIWDPVVKLLSCSLLLTGKLIVPTIVHLGTVQYGISCKQQARCKYLSKSLSTCCLPLNMIVMYCAAGL